MFAAELDEAAFIFELLGRTVPVNIAQPGKERKCIANVTQKYLGHHARVSTRFSESQRAYSEKREEAAIARKLEVGVGDFF